MSFKENCQFINNFNDEDSCNELEYDYQDFGNDTHLANLQYRIELIKNLDETKWIERFEQYCEIDGKKFVQIDPALRTEITHVSEYYSGYIRNDIVLDNIPHVKMIKTVVPTINGFTHDSLPELTIYRFNKIFIVSIQFGFRVHDYDDLDDEDCTILDKLVSFKDKYFLGYFSSYEESNSFVEKICDISKNIDKSKISTYDRFNILSFIFENI